MPYDIAMCGGGVCHLRYACYKHTGEILGRQDFMMSVPYNAETKTCDMFLSNEHQIQKRAYEIWLSQEKPDNKAEENWQQAQAEIIAEIAFVL